MKSGESLTANAIADIENEVMTTYGVDADDVTIDVAYVLSGEIQVTNDGSLADEEFAEELEQSIAALLGVHSSDVDVTIDDSGVASYTVRADSAGEAAELQEVLAQNGIEDSLILPDGVDATDLNVASLVAAEVTVTVDTSDADNNLDNAAADLEHSFRSEGWNADAESTQIL